MYFLFQKHISLEFTAYNIYFGHKTCFFYCMGLLLLFEFSILGNNGENDSSSKINISLVWMCHAVTKIRQVERSQT